MSWPSGTLYAFDVESTGVDVFTDRIVTASLVKIEAGTPVDNRSWLVAVDVEIPEAATNVHGITTEHARANGTSALEAIAELGDIVTSILRSGFPLVTFNAVFDLSILDVELDRLGLPTLAATLTPEQWHTVIDPLVLAKGLEHVLRRKYVKGLTFKLPALCERYRVPFTESHDAHADAIGAGLLAVQLAHEEPSFESMAPAQLHTLQKTWRREDMADLRRYFDARGREHDGCDGGWPLHSTLAVGAQGVLT